MKTAYSTPLGRAYCADSIVFMKGMADKCVDLVITSPPFALLRKKSYGNVAADAYADWFTPFAQEIHRILKPRGSLVIDIGGAWNSGEATRSLYHFELLLSLCNGSGHFKLAQEFYWYNPAKLPSPAQWVTVKRIRVKDAVNPIWWLSKTSNPVASNLRVLKPYTRSMEHLLKNGYKSGMRPCEHMISTKWGTRHEGAIPSNLISASNTSSSDPYLRGCRNWDIKPHPARFVRDVPDFFIRFLTKPGELVFDPFAGSNVVGAVAEKLNRQWISVDNNPEYVLGSSFRFNGSSEKAWEWWAKQSVKNT